MFGQEGFSIDFVFFQRLDLHRYLATFQKKVFFYASCKNFKKTYIAYLYWFFAHFGMCYDFWTLESRIQPWIG